MRAHFKKIVNGRPQAFTWITMPLNAFEIRSVKCQAHTIIEKALAGSNRGKVPSVPKNFDLLRTMLRKNGMCGSVFKIERKKAP
jgi:hypothetical protein